MRSRPYIGVTGFMSAGEVSAAAMFYREAWAETGREPTHDLMVGVLASSKTVAGQANKYPLRYPPREDTASVFPTCSTCRGDGVLVYSPMNSTIADDTRIPCPECSGGGPRFYRRNLVHYATGGIGSGAPIIGEPSLAEDLVRAMKIAGPRCGGVQINGAWPRSGEVLAFRMRFPEARVVLQLGPIALADLDYRPRAIAERVRDDYGDAITDVLVDVSGGRGIAVNEGQRDALGSLLRDLMAHGNWTIGMAGGLDAAALTHPETTGAWRQLLRSGCSIDAEGRLRDGADGGGNLDLDKVRAYLRAAVVLAAGDGR